MRIGALVVARNGTQALRRAVYGEVALRQNASLEFTRSWRNLQKGVEAGSFDAVFVQMAPDDPDHPDSNWPIELEALRSSLGADAVIPYFCDGTPSASTRRRLVNAGFPFVVSVDADHDSATTLRLLARISIYRTIRRAQAPSTSAEELLRAAFGWPPSSSVRELAGALHLSPRSLRRKTKSLIGLVPCQLVRWTRLFEAAALSEFGVSSRGRLAHLVEVGSSSALCRLSRDLTQLPLATILGSEEPVSFLQSLFRDRSSQIR